MRNLLVFMPPELAALLVVAAGLAMIVGARPLAGQLFVAALALVLLPFVLEPLFDLLPAWLLLALLASFTFGALRAILELAIGRRAADHTIGILAADVIRAGVLAPFRLLGWIVRRLTRN